MAPASVTAPTVRFPVPTLDTVTVFAADCVPTAAVNAVGVVVLIAGDVALPVSAAVERPPPGALCVIRMLAVFEPGVVGAKRTDTVQEPAGPSVPVQLLPDT